MFKCQYGIDSFLVWDLAWGGYVALTVPDVRAFSPRRRRPFWKRQPHLGSLSPDDAEKGVCGWEVSAQAPGAQRDRLWGPDGSGNESESEPDREDGTGFECAFFLIMLIKS